MKNYPDIPKTGNGPLQLFRMEEFTRNKLISFWKFSCVSHNFLIFQDYNNLLPLIIRLSVALTGSGKMVLSYLITSGGEGADL